MSRPVEHGTAGGPVEASEGALATEDVESAPISPELRRRLIAAAERPLRVRRAVLLLAGHAAGHLPGTQHACRACHAHWPCEAVQRAAQPALEAFADCDASLAEPSVGTGTPAEAHRIEHEKYGTWPCAWQNLDQAGCPVWRDTHMTTPAEAVSGGSGRIERQEPTVAEALTEAFTAGLEQCRRRAVTAEADVERLTAEVARYRAAIEETVELLETPSAGWPRRVHSILAAALGDGE